MNIRKSIALRLLNFCQRLVNYAYEKEGLTDRVLKDQIKINELRNKHNLIEDENEYVQ